MPKRKASRKPLARIYPLPPDLKSIETIAKVRKRFEIKLRLQNPGISEEELQRRSDNFIMAIHTIVKYSQKK